MHILHPDFDIKISNACCEEMKKKPFKRYVKAHGMLGYMTGERQAEGGARALNFAFQSTPSVWRVTASTSGWLSEYTQFQSTPSVWRVTFIAWIADREPIISIHTLRVEGDRTALKVC